MKPKNPTGELSESKKSGMGWDNVRSGREPILVSRPCDCVRASWQTSGF